MRFRSTVFAGVLMTFALTTAGGCCCFTFPYDTQTYLTWRELERGVNANPPAPTQLAGAEQTVEQQTGIRIRLPVIFNSTSMGTPLMRNSAEAGTAVPVERIQPGFPLPGYYITYEAFFKDGDQRRELPVYCYLGALPKDKSPSKIRDEISERLAEKYPDAKWETDKSLPELAGKAVSYLSVAGPQLFVPKVIGKPEEMPGRLDVYVLPAEHANVVVAWRAPQAIAHKLSFFRAAEASVATVSSEKPGRPIEETPVEPVGGGGPTDPPEQTPAQGDYVQFPSAEVQLIPPVGFHKVPSINGFQKEGSGANIKILPQPSPYETLVASYTDDYFRTNNLTVISREGITAGRKPAMLWFIERPGGAPYWQYVIGDESQSFILTGDLAEETDEANKAAVKRSLLSARQTGGS